MTKTEWEDQSKNSVIIIKRRNVPKNKVLGIIQTIKGGVLAKINASTFKHLKQELRKTGLLPQQLVIEKEVTYFNRIKHSR